jgi:spermine synthase
MEAVLSSYVPGLKRQHIFNFAGSFIVLLTGDRGTHVTLRGFPQGLVTCNIEYYKEDEEKPLFLFEVIHVAAVVVFFFFF